MYSQEKLPCTEHADCFSLSLFLNSVVTSYTTEHSVHGVSRGLRVDTRGCTSPSFSLGKSHPHWVCECLCAGHPTQKERTLGSQCKRPALPTASHYSPQPPCLSEAESTSRPRSQLPQVLVPHSVKRHQRARNPAASAPSAFLGAETGPRAYIHRFPAERVSTTLAFLQEVPNNWQFSRRFCLKSQREPLTLGQEHRETEEQFLPAMENDKALRENTALQKQRLVPVWVFTQPVWAVHQKHCRCSWGTP